MRLVSATLEGFKRFEARSEINLDFKLVAVVGPNESGKSSLLRGLSLLTDPSGFTARGDIQDASRHSSLPPTHELVKARFAIEREDKAEIAQIDNAASLRWFTVALRADGQLRYDVEPRPTRILTKRGAAARQARLATKTKWAQNLRSESGAALSERLARVADYLSSAEPSLDETALAEVEALGRELPPEKPVTKALVALLPLERSSDPYVECVGGLRTRVPEFLLFGEEDRSLASAYDLEQVGTAPPAALRNLCRLAGLNLSQLWERVSQALPAEAETLLDKANRQLTEVFTTRWSQSGVEVRFGRDGQQLRIFAGNSETANGYVNIAERSDGMKWFVSLLAFLSERRSVVPPILLVDEAETHLHYDAQADLVQMLGRQVVASKVVYTTHSAGCLPEDLGAGLRAVKPNFELERSTIVNWVWSGEGNLGLTPVLLAMGASALAFTPARLAVITEGPSDFVLLPTLMREATRRGVLGFQLAPGASEAGVNALANIERDAARVLYLTDGDQGGKEVRKKLMRFKIPADRIFSLTTGATVEDLVRDQAYWQAVNEELRRSYGDAVQMPKSAIPARGRAAAVEAWCKKAKVAPPKKRGVAIQVLANSSSVSGVLKPSARNSLVRLFDQIQARFNAFSTDDDISG